LRLNEIELIDGDAEFVVAQAGVTFDMLVKSLVPKGFLVPVSPGTCYVTVGGAVANDIHGKNHDADGSFGDFVEWMDIITPSGELIRIDDDTNQRLFRATIGGCGLTGFILRVCFRVLPCPSNAVDVVETRARDLAEFFELLTEARAENKYSVGWIDALKSGKALGRGIVERGDISGESVRQKNKLPISVPFDLPSWTLNSLTVSAFNSVYYHRVPAAGRARRIPIVDFFYPLDAVKNWNRIYGKRGLFQFQCVLPESSSFENIRAILLRTSASGIGSFLAVLKTLGREGRGYLSFPHPGHTLSLDLPWTRRSERLIQDLVSITADAGGRIYLAKDAVLTRKQFVSMYPNYTLFRSVIDEIDPNSKMDSEMARRLMAEQPMEARS
jgi:decaprenylphospho-beta-D-ribofuranose 2-oxidase